jgi:hypothetical protein
VARVVKIVVRAQPGREDRREHAGGRDGCRERLA